MTISNPPNNSEFQFSHLENVGIKIISGGSDGKESACNEGDLGSILGLGRSPREGHGRPLSHSCLEDPKDRGAWLVTVHGVAESDRTEQITP